MPLDESQFNFTIVYNIVPNPNTCYFCGLDRMKLPSGLTFWYRTDRKKNYKFAACDTCKAAFLPEIR